MRLLISDGVELRTERAARSRMVWPTAVTYVPPSPKGPQVAPPGKTWFVWLTLKQRFGLPGLAEISANR